MINQLKLSSRLTLTAVAVTGLCLSSPVFAAAMKAEPDAAKAADVQAQKKEMMPAKTMMQSSLSKKDKAFMMAAAKGGMMEVQMGQMAEQKAKNKDVKKFGKRMVADHGKANSELMAIAQKKGVDLSKQKPAMAKMGADFDKDYVAAMVMAHEKDAAAFSAEAKDGTDADVKAFAAKTLKVIQKHLAMIKGMQAKMK